MNDCMYCDSGKGLRVRFVGSFCSKCNTPVAVCFGEYFGDVKRGETTFHLIQLDTTFVCAVCGHTTDIASKPCERSKSLQESVSEPLTNITT